MFRGPIAVLLLVGCDDVGLDTLSVDLVGPVLEVVPEGDIAFGGAAFNGGSATASLDLHSTGDEDLVIMGVDFDDETPLAFSIRADLPLPMKLPPGESFPVELVFEPDQVGAYNGWVMITVEAKDGTRELSRRLIGQGCDPQYAAGDCN